MFYITKGKFIILMGLCGFLRFAQQAEAEEALTLLNTPIFPTNETVLLDLSPSPPLAFEEGVSREASFPEEISFEELFHLPDGRELSERSLRGQFVLGKRVETQVFRPDATFQLSSKGGFGTYLNKEETGFKSTPVDPELLFEEQITWGFQTAEATIEFLDSTAMPLIGGVVSGLTQVGQTLHQMDRRLKKQNLHLQYLNGKPAASYRVKF